MLVFYFSEIESWKACCNRILDTSFVQVESYDDYWDVDGYRVVLQNIVRELKNLEEHDACASRL